MTLNAHLETLEEKHARLEHEIAEETHRPLPDFTRITQLKKQKLHIKELMQYLHRYEQREEHVSA